ncbi:nitrite extrusion protein 1 NarK [Nitzschia inconspicua]|uniref:Nitrite extrusion protein 1 NarK n=1 Tax=Nitzschia inconspicua TaxID=303405 RepID=A0A9K3Q196_9STRA|nr:nitrite extrusion protein 1 NarK [Nitzschia inconspicua]
MNTEDPPESGDAPREKQEGFTPSDQNELHVTITTSDSSLPEVAANPLIEFQLDPLEQEAKRVRDEWEMCARDPFKASPQSKYKRYDIPVDHAEGDRATFVKILSCKRPHMRGLHCAWISFFLAFMIWFAPAPLLREIQTTLNLTKEQIWTSSITNDCTAIFMRIVMGPVCDNYAARWPMAIIIMAASIPTAMLGLVNSAKGLAWIRFFIGIAGSTFVMSQFWASRMFARDIAGTANGIVGGWGNLGGAWTQVFMGTLLFPAFERYYGSAEKSWRVICVIPASIAFAWGAILPWISDDAPMGNYSEMKKRGTMDRIVFTTSLRSGMTRNTWILFIQYACCFGVELVMNNASVLYYNYKFDLVTEDAAKIGFLYGSMNIFARAIGGLFSDRLNINMGMRGRLWLQMTLLLCEGILIIVFAYAQSLAGAIVTMCAFSVFTQAAEGAVFGIVPYVHKLHTGAVAGFVGSGGNVGSVVYGIGFRNMEYKSAFLMMGSIVIASSFLSIFIHIPCHAGMLWGEDNNTVLQSRERYRLQRERATQAIEEQNQARLHGNRRDGGEGTVEGGATVESLEKVEHGSDGGDAAENP